MALSKLTDDLNVVQGLPDSPNAGVGGLTSTQLKVKFDTAGNAIKTYLNNTLTTETDTQLALKAPLASPTFTGTPTVTQVQWDNAGGTVGVGKVAWNATEGTLEFGLVGGNVTTKIGQDQTFRALNNTGSTLSKGQAVYITGASGQRPTVALSQANAEATSSKTFGVVAETIANNAQGFVKVTGIIDSIDTSAFTDGATLYLSPTTAGGFTSTKPVAPNHMVLVGFCIRSHATQGQILVKVQNGNELDELHDVLISGKANKDLLAYDSVTGLWKNQTFTTLDLPTKTYVDSQDATKVTASGGTLNNGTLGGTTTTISATTTTVTGAADFQGITTANTQAADNNTTRVATTAFVINQASTTTPNTVGSAVAAVGTMYRFARADHTHQLATSGVTAGTYPKVTVDVYGRVTGASATISTSDIGSGTLGIARGGTGVTSSTGSTNLVLSDLPTLSGPRITNTAGTFDIWGGMNFYTANGATATGSLTAGGTLTANSLKSNALGTGTVYSNAGVLTNTNPSDANLKTDIQDIGYGIETVNQIRPVTYRWKDKEVYGEDLQIGIIAQELEQVLPEVVQKSEEGQYGVDYVKLIPVLVKAVQDLSKEVQELRAKIGV